MTVLPSLACRFALRAAPGFGSRTATLLFGLFVAGCAAPAPGRNAPTSGHPAQPIGETMREATATKAAPSETKGASFDGIAVFDRMVTMVRRYHLFAPQTAKNLGKEWEQDLPRLRAEFANVRDEAALSVALWHFGNSLHDVHCQFRAKDRGERIKLGFRAAVERQGDGYQFYVERVQDASLRGQPRAPAQLDSRGVASGAPAQLEEGDIVVAIDGVSAANLLDAHDLVSNMNSKENIAFDVARYLTSRRTSTTLVRAGATTSWTVRPRKGGPERTVSLTWKGASSDDNDFAIDYASKDCVSSDAKDYGNGYTLTARGYRVCIYTSHAPKYRDYPIVRQASFRYDEIPHGVLADHALLVRTFSAARPKGVLLDVQENGGGINPNLFIEWWTDKPYTDRETRVLLDETLLKDQKGASHINSLNEAIKAWYIEALKSRKPDQKISAGRPFMCKPDTCTWDNHYVPKHRVTKAPVALLLGPGCASSCDTLAWHFDKDDTGPIVGRGGMAGFTTHRARFDVAAVEGRPVIGQIDFAISYDTLAGGQESIEAVPVKIDVPIARTFENHLRFDALLVESAIRALEARRSR